MKEKAMTREETRAKAREAQQAFVLEATWYKARLEEMRAHEEKKWKSGKES